MPILPDYRNGIFELATQGTPLLCYRRVKLNGLGTVGCHSFELLAGKLLVSILSVSLSMLSSFFNLYHVLQLLLAKCIFSLHSVFASLSLCLHLKGGQQNYNPKLVKYVHL